MPITSRIKAGAVAALAGAALSGLALPTQAQAATASVYIRACNYGERTLSAITMEGKSAGGGNQWVSKGTDGYDCASMERWQVGQTLKVTLDWADGGVTYRKCSIASDATDGSTLYCKYYYS